MTARPRYVIDASVGVKWLFPEAGSEQALALLGLADTESATLLAPDVFAAEVTNVIWKRARLQREITDEEARARLEHLRRTLPQLLRTADLVEQALELALTFRVAVYDCLYVALALRDGSTLVTADRRLVRALGPVTGRVVHIEELRLAT